jgi:hypothetical protein
MSKFEVLEVRFILNGEFVLYASKMLYCNGDYGGVEHIEGWSEGKHRMHS